MKKWNFLGLLFCAIALSAVTFTACVDDNADEGMPYLEVSPGELAYTLAGEPIGPSTVSVKTNRPWKLTIENGDWVTASASSGTGDAEIELVVPAAASGQAATLLFSLNNNYGAYITREVILEQGEVGAISRLVGYIRNTWPVDPPPGDVNLNYSQATIEGVILANNAAGNNLSKLYIGDNVTQPNSAIILFGTQYNTPENFPVGKKVTLDLSAAKYAPYQKLRELKDVQVTLLDDPAVELKVPSLSVAQVNSGGYQGQYVRVNEMTPSADVVGKPWATTNYQTFAFTGSGDASLAVYMRGASDAVAFKNLTVIEHTGAMYGVAEQFGTTIQLLPTKTSDIEGFFDAKPTVTTLAATEVDKTSAVLNASLAFINGVTEVGFEYLAFAQTPDWSAATTIAGTLADNKWSSEVTGLTLRQKYAYRAYAKADQTYYGEVMSFSPNAAPTVVLDFSSADSYPSDFPVESANKVLVPTPYTFGGYTLTFAGAGSGNGFYTPTKGYVLWGKKGAYITLPAIEGKSLAQVRCIVPSGASDAVQVGIYSADGAKAVQGGEAIVWVEDGENVRTYDYTLGGTAANTPYRVQVESNHNAQIQRLELWYNDGATPGAPIITANPEALVFGAAADSEGQKVAITVENQGALNLYFKSTDATQFPMSYDSTTGELTVTAAANDSEQDPKAATITAYLADVEGGAYTYSQDITLSQAPKAPKTVAELVTYLKTVAPVVGAQTPLTAWNGVVVNGYIAGNNAGSNLNKMLAVVDKDGTANAGIILYDDSYNTTDDYPVGAKISVTIMADTYCKNNFGMLRLEKAATVVDKTTTVQLSPVSITAAQFNAGGYLGMYVKITGLKYKQTAPQQWSPVASKTASQTFISGTEEVVTRTYGGCSWASDYISPVQTSGAIAGVGQVYQGSASATAGQQLNPLSAADVADFEVTTPMIVDATPASLNLPAAGGSKTVELSILNQGANVVTASGLSAPFSASVSGKTVTVTAEPNLAETILEQVLTLTLAGGNSIEVPVSQQGAGGQEISVELGSSETGFPKAYNDIAGTFTVAGYSWDALQVQQTSTALILRASESGWISTPAIDGMKLTEIKITCSANIANSSKAVVVTADGTVVSAEQLVGKTSPSFPGPFTFPITNPEVNTSYRLKAVGSNVQLINIVLTYSK